MRPLLHALLATLGAALPLAAQDTPVASPTVVAKQAKKIVFVAGPRSHGYGSHEHRAGCLLLARLLDTHADGVTTAVHDKGWPSDPTAFDDADALVLYMDGGGGHPVLHHLEKVAELMERGVGLACLHYAVEVPEGRPAERFLDWIGGHFETWWSVNPSWTANFTALPEHAITRGVQPFAIHDEWYYHMRFRPEMKGVVPILSAIPAEDTRQRKHGPHSGNPTVQARTGQPEHVAWAHERADGGRGFGFTGGHVHWNWAHDDYRKLVLNALVWVAGGQIPPNGIESAAPSLADLEANQDYDPPARFDRAGVQTMLASWRKPARVR